MITLLKNSLVLVFVCVTFIEIYGQKDTASRNSFGPEKVYVGVSGNLLLPVDKTFIGEKEISPFDGMNMFASGGFNVFAGYDINRWFGLRHNIINMFTPTHITYPYTGQDIYNKRVKKDWAMFMSTDVIFRLEKKGFSMSLSPGFAYGFTFSYSEHFEYPIEKRLYRTTFLHAAYGLKLGLSTRYDFHKNFGLFIDVDFYNMSIDLRRFKRYNPTDDGYEWFSTTTFENLKVSLKPFSYWNLSLGFAYKFRKNK